MFRIILGAVILFGTQLVFFDASIKVLTFSHNVYSDVKVVYHASMKVIEKQETVKKFGELVEDVKDGS